MSLFLLIANDLQAVQILVGQQPVKFFHSCIFQDTALSMSRLLPLSNSYFAFPSFSIIHSHLITPENYRHSTEGLVSPLQDILLGDFQCHNF
jgi:hypothetical protein